MTRPFPLRRQSSRRQPDASPAHGTPAARLGARLLACPVQLGRAGLLARPIGLGSAAIAATLLAMLASGCLPIVEPADVSCPFSPCTFFSFSNFQNAAVVIGQPNFTTNTAPGAVSATTISPSIEGAPWFDGTNLYIGDSGANRVLGFSGLPTVNGAAASFVLGQADSFTTSASGATAIGLFFPTTVQESGGQFFVADLSNLRILIYNTPPLSSVAADIAVGEVNLTTATSGCTQNGVSTGRGVYVAGTRLFLPDTNNNRVLIWNQIPTASGANADLVLGQTSFTSCAVNGGGTASASTLNAPFYVWSDGDRVAVSDSNNNRVLIWSHFPTSNGQPADLVLGQGNGVTAFTSSTAGSGQSGLSFPEGLESNGLELLVADNTNNRILVWNTFPTQVGQVPDVVLGQSSFAGSAANAGGTVGANTLSSPSGLRLIAPDSLIVTEFSNNRVLIFRSQ